MAIVQMAEEARVVREIPINSDLIPSTDWIRMSGIHSTVNQKMLQIFLRRQLRQKNKQLQPQLEDTCWVHGLDGYHKSSSNTYAITPRGSQAFPGTHHEER